MPSSSQNDAHLKISFVALEANMKQYVSTLTDAQLIQQYHKYAANLINSPKVPNDYYIPALQAKWLSCPALAFNNTSASFSSVTDYALRSVDAYYDAGGVNYNYDIWKVSFMFLI